MLLILILALLFALITYWWGPVWQQFREPLPAPAPPSRTAPATIGY